MNLLLFNTATRAKNHLLTSQTARDQIHLYKVIYVPLLFLFLYRSMKVNCQIFCPAKWRTTSQKRQQHQKVLNLFVWVPLLSICDWRKRHQSFTCDRTECKTSLFLIRNTLNGKLAHERKRFAKQTPLKLLLMCPFCVRVIFLHFHFHYKFQVSVKYTRTYKSIHLKLIHMKKFCAQTIRYQHN